MRRLAWFYFEKPIIVKEVIWVMKNTVVYYFNASGENKYLLFIFGGIYYRNKLLKTQTGIKGWLARETGRLAREKVLLLSF